MASVQKRRAPLAAITLVLASFFILQSVHVAEARKVSGDRLARLLELCLLNDGVDIGSGSTWGCCIPQRYCVVCTGEPSADKQCDLQTAREQPRSGTAAPAPGSIAPETRSPGSMSRVDQLLEYLR